MQQVIQEVLDFFEKLGIDWQIVMLYICAGLIVKSYMDTPWPIPFTKRLITTAWKTLIVGTIVVAIYVSIAYKEFDQREKLIIFRSYFFTTSFYELALRDLVADWIVSGLRRVFRKSKSEE